MEDTRLKSGDEKDPHAVELGRKGGEKGGRVRAERMSAEDRQESARKAAQARWANPTSRLPKATHVGLLKIGSFEIPCYVLENQKRVLSQRGMVSTLGMARGGSRSGGGDRIAQFAGGNALKPFISEDLLMASSQPMRFVTPTGPEAYGYEATVLADLCDAVLAARKEDKLQPQQKHIAERAELLLRAFSRVGIIALVDEATGYQADRDRYELHRILEAYIARELLPWAKRFPDEFYKEMFRLQGWQYSPPALRRPIMVGKLTEEIVYKRLPPGVLDELTRLNPKDERGRRRHKHHQFLTEDIGHPHLAKHLASVTTLMRVSSSWGRFMKLMNKAFPPNPKQGLLPFPPTEGEEVDDDE